MWNRIDGLRVLGLGTPGELRDWLNDCVLTGDKRATAGLATDYEEEDEPLEHVGERLALVDNSETRIGTVEVTVIEVVRFDEVTWEFAQSEGEGFRSLEHWRDAHARYWREGGVEVAPDTRVVCMRFRVL